MEIEKLVRKEVKNGKEERAVSIMSAEDWKKLGYEWDEQKGWTLKAKVN